jgi:hypothetical protein
MITFDEARMIVAASTAVREWSRLPVPDHLWCGDGQWSCPRGVKGYFTSSVSRPLEPFRQPLLSR